MTGMPLPRARAPGPALNFVIFALASGCSPVRPEGERPRAVHAALPPDASTIERDEPLQSAPATALVEASAPAARPPLGESACRELLSQRRALIAKGITTCGEDKDCGTYGDVRHPCGDGAIDQHTASAVEDIDAQLLGDACYLRRTGTCQITPYRFVATCATNGRCAVK